MQKDTSDKYIHACHHLRGQMKNCVGKGRFHQNQQIEKLRKKGDRLHLQFFRAGLGCCGPWGNYLPPYLLRPRSSNLNVKQSSPPPQPTDPFLRVGFAS